jgi:hypothetical protein
MKFRNYIGLFLIVAIVLAVAGFSYISNGNKNLTSIFTSTITKAPKVTKPVAGFIGSEKKAFFDDEEVKQILTDSYGLNITANKKGSIEMVNSAFTDVDYLFPSNNIATEIYKQKNSGNVNAQSIFYSPIVIYSWNSLLPDLQLSGLVTTNDGVNYLDLELLVDLIIQNKTWQDIKATQLKGNISISSTSPSVSSSGNLFAVLALQAILKQANTATLADLIPEVKIKVKSLFDKMGLLETSSGDIFDKFLSLGRTTYPFVVGYESQIIEQKNRDRRGLNEVITLYPKSTVWAQHDFISINDKGKELSNALNTDEKLAKIAWEKYGLRRLGYNLNKERYKTLGILPEPTSIIKIPKIEVVEQLIDLPK